MSCTSMPDLKGRLENYLKARGRSSEIEELYPDASTRGYFRIPWNGLTAVACVYPSEFDPAVGVYVDVTGLFLAGGLPIAEIYDIDVEQGVVIQEDLGDRILRDELASTGEDRRDRLQDEAISLIARIQAATALAFERDSIASRLKFDTEKLIWELDYFKTHYFTTLKKQQLDESADRTLSGEFMELSTELETLARVLCHRDFHSANLMVDGQGQLRIIDHQDARIGSITYDLVSLLLDRLTQLPGEEWLNERMTYFLTEREKLELPAPDREAFDREFQLQTIQRCLKAAGTFSFQSAVRGKTHFAAYIEPMLRASLNAATELDRFPCLQKVLNNELRP